MSGAASGIVGWGGYVPRLRLVRKAAVAANAWFAPGLRAYADGERAVCNWDEDSLTLAVEAARDALAGQEAAAVSAVAFASTTHPFADRQNASLLATALNLPETLATTDVAGSQRAGTSGLLAALDGIAARGGRTLFVAADARRARAAGPQELLFGAGAAALLLGRDDLVAEFVGAHQLSVDFVDHFRGETAEFDYQWEERWVRDEGYLKIVPRALDGLFSATGVAPAAIDHFAMPCVLKGVAGQLAKRAGIRDGAVRDNLHGAMGEAGTAHALVMLAHTLEAAQPGETVLVVGFGQGCDALLFRATDAIAQRRPPRGIRGSLARRKEETNYNRFLAFSGLIDRDLGMRAEGDRRTPLSTLYRKRDMILGFVGGKCRVCGTIQYPRANICVNPNCGAIHSQDPHPLAETPAAVLTWTADNLTFTPDPPAHYGLVQFAEGGRFMADFTDVDAGAVEVGMPMRMTFRVKERDEARGFAKYFWKAAPAG